MESLTNVGNYYRNTHKIANYITKNIYMNLNYKSYDKDIRDLTNGN